MLSAAVPVLVALLQCPDGSAPPCGRAVPRAPAATSVAVLYFDNLSRDTSDAYVADGLTEELMTRLGEIERLQVKSRTAVQRYRGRPIDDPVELARALNVAHLVSGTVQQGGGHLRVTVELTRAASGVRVWGQSYERPTTDLMGVEAEIAQAIAEGVGGRLAPAERRSLSARPSRNPEAYDHLMGSQVAYLAGTAFGVMGDADGAMGILNRMRPQGAFLWTLMRDPWFDGIRNDPRFQALAEESRPPSPED